VSSALFTKRHHNAVPSVVPAPDGTVSMSGRSVHAGHLSEFVTRKIRQK